MLKQIIFSISILITLGVFGYTTLRVISFFKLTKANFPIKDFWKRIVLTIKVVLLQSKIFRRPVLGFLHAIILWGFIVILVGSLEMIIDGITGTERILSFMGPVYDVIFALGDIYGFLILLSIIVFLFRRLFLNVPRFSGIEMKHISHQDANFALTLILLLMISLLGMNAFYIALNPEDYKGVFPISAIIAQWFSGMSHHSIHILHEVNWWSHILLIFLFANILPYSKHFHVFMSAPNVFLSRLEPLGYMSNMENVTKEVKLMLDPDAAFADPPEGESEAIERFGVLDVEDVSWKNYFDSLACTECGRCTAVCPANITGKMLSPRKVMMDLRARMKEKAPGLIKNKEFSDNKSFIKDYVSAEEIWACTTCNACAQECPININHPSLILDLRRYLVMEEAAAPAELNAVFTNIENNGAPWQYSPEDRMLWADELEIPILADKFNEGKKPEYLFWVGSAGAFDDRYKKVTRAFAKILKYLDVDYAVLGTEETDSGDIVRRAGNEMLFQMQALQNIEIFNMYEVKKIITCDPHDFNTFLNEYPDLGGKYEVIHHTQFLNNFIKEGKLKITSQKFKDKTIVFHDPCYLGRANGEYKAPRKVLNAIPSTKVEMKRNKSYALCCGAGGGQMFKECEKGDKEIFIERTEEALETKADIIATACPFCMVMMTDGLKYKNKEDEVFNFDIAELVADGLEL